MAAGVERGGDPDGGMARAAALLHERGGRRLPFEPVFRPLRAPGAPADAPPEDAAPAWAVDGSEAVLLDNGALWIVAHRAAAVRWPGPLRPEPLPVVSAVVPAEAGDAVARACAALGLEPPARIATAEAFAEALRGLAETRAALDALRGMGPGDLLLLDGALEGLPTDAARRLAPVRALARERGVRLVAVAKRSALSVEGVPLVPALDRAARAAGVPAPWSCPVPDVPGAHVARLHPAASFAFRVDGDEADLPALLPSCRDAVYTGYPYPLALAHNAVALTGPVREALRRRLEDAVARVAGPAGLALLEDPHALLDRNVP